MPGEIVPMPKHDRQDFFSASILLGFFCLLLLHTASLNAQGDQRGRRVDLPENGRVRVINRRGSIRVETWNEEQVSVLSEFDGPAPKVSPLLIQKTVEQLVLNVPAAPARQRNMQRVNLVVRVPERAKTSVITNDGGVVIAGISRELNVLTRSGNISAEIPETSEADVRGVSLKGSATTSVKDASFGVKLPGLTTGDSEAQVFHVRLNGGQKAVELRTTSGNIRLTTTAGKEVSTVAENPRPRSQRNRAPELNSNPALPKPTGTPAPAQPEQVVDEDDIVRVDTQLVTMNVSVVERNTNRGVLNLKAKDFKLSENGQPQEIASFDSSNAPFNLILLIDLSGSTKEVVRLIREAALRFVSAARPADRIAVITFANTPVVVSSLTEDRELLRQRINAIEEPKGSTRLYDSLKFTLDEIAREAKGSRRNAIVLMSDGLDSTLPNVTGEGSTIPYKELLDQVSEFDGVVYSLWLDTEYEALSPQDVQPETVDVAHDRMKELADAGGGVFYEVEKLQDLAGAYEQVVADLGTVYSIGYKPRNNVRDGKWRTIRVDVLQPSAVARGKRGYYAN
jgi:VWFA-related protein